MEEMTIEEIKEMYRDEWVLIEVTEVDESGVPIRGIVIAHSKSRDDTYKAMEKTKSKDIAHFYTGEIPKKGYAVALNLPAKSYVDGLLGLSYLKNFNIILNFRDGVLEIN